MVAPPFPPELAQCQGPHDRAGHRVARRLGRWTAVIGSYWGFTGVNTEFWAEGVWVTCSGAPGASSLVRGRPRKAPREGSEAAGSLGALSSASPSSCSHTGPGKAGRSASGAGTWVSLALPGAPGLSRLPP